MKHIKQFEDYDDNDYDIDFDDPAYHVGDYVTLTEFDPDDELGFKNPFGKIIALEDRNDHTLYGIEYFDDDNNLSAYYTTYGAEIITGFMTETEIERYKIKEDTTKYNL